MSAEMTRVQRRQQDTRARIFQAAMDLFLQKGFEATTVLEITQAADIGKGTFFTYFPTKEAIVAYHAELLAEEAIARGEKALALGTPVLEILHQLIEYVANWHEENAGLHRQMPLGGLLGGLESDEPSPWEGLVGLFAKLAAVGQERREWRRDHSPQDIAAVAFGATIGVTMAWTHNAEGRSLSEMLVAGLDIMLTGVSAQTGEASS